MERLTIDEVIEHCKRKTSRYENLNGINTLETADISLSFIKEYWEHRQVKEYLEELKRYRDLAEKDLLLRLPCKVGDKLYRLDSVGFIISDTVHSIHILQDTAYFEMNYWNEDICLSAVGKTIFTTQAEAEHYRKLVRLYSLRKQKSKNKENNKDNE